MGGGVGVRRLCQNKFSNVLGKETGHSTWGRYFLPSFLLLFLSLPSEATAKGRMSCLKEEETKTAFKLLEVMSCLKQQQENRAKCYLPCRDQAAMTSSQRDYVSTLLEYVSTLVDDESMCGHRSLGRR